MERCPDNIPDYLVSPRLSWFRGILQKRYEDGFIAILKPVVLPHSEDEVHHVESRFSDGSKHLETQGKPEFYSKDYSEDDMA